MRRIAGYGWIPDRPDRRDVPFLLGPGSVFPASGLTPDWSQGMPPAWDQGQLGSCTGNMFAAQAWFLGMKQKEPALMPSRLFSYWCARAREGTQETDAGAQIRDVIAGAITEGICPEVVWPYAEDKVTIEPSSEAFSRAQYCEVLDYRRVDNTSEDELVAALMAGPLCFGATIYESFETTAVGRTGMVPWPKPSESVVGGHALWLCQLDLKQRLAKFRNSWGAGWGQNGYGWFPIPYVTNDDLATDFWLVTRVT